MRLFNWAKAFEEKPTCEDILRSVRRIEITYWVYMVILVVISLNGIGMFMDAPEGDLKKHILGLFIAMVGLVYIAVIKIWANVKLSMLYTMWDSQNRLKAEIAKLESADL